MFYPSGCPKGSMRKGNSCEKIQFPMIGTSLVPNVVNKLGCNHVHGKWNKDYDVCIQEENNNRKEEVRSGCTAPIKGVIVCWYMLDASKMKDDCDDKSCGWLNAYFDISPVIRKNQGIEVLDDPIYDYQLSEYTPYCYWGHEEADQLYEIIKDEALSAAKEIKEGTIAGIMNYCTPDGRPCSPHHPDAILMEFPEKRETESCEKKRPFKVRH